MIKELINLANHLDTIGFNKEADYLDAVIKRANPMGPVGYGVLGAGMRPADTINPIGSPETEGQGAYGEPVAHEQSLATGAPSVKVQQPIPVKLTETHEQIGTYLETYGKTVHGRQHRFMPLSGYEGKYPPADNIPSESYMVN